MDPAESKNDVSRSSQSFAACGLDDEIGRPSGNAHEGKHEYQLVSHVHVGVEPGGECRGGFTPR